jgi:hypothetical protein
MFQAGKYTGPDGLIAKALPVQAVGQHELESTESDTLQVDEAGKVGRIHYAQFDHHCRGIQYREFTDHDGHGQDSGNRILKSMGATNRHIMRIFVYQGAFVGVSGTLIGGIVGTAFCYLQDRYRFISLPAISISSARCPWISSSPMCLRSPWSPCCTLWFSSVYPARKAAELIPVDAIRSE